MQVDTEAARPGGGRGGGEEALLKEGGRRAGLLAPAVAPLTALTALDLSGNCMGPPDAHWAVSLASLDKLRRLDLSDNLLPPRGIEALAGALRAMTALQVRPWREAGPPNHHDDKVDSDQ